jgi:hypothetical protein
MNRKVKRAALAAPVLVAVLAAGCGGAGGPYLLVWENAPAKGTASKVEACLAE